MDNQQKSEVIEYMIKAAASKLKPDEVSPETLLKDDLGFDSLAAVELVLDIEDKFGISLSDQEIMSLKTVGDVFHMIEQKGFQATSA